MLDVGCGGGLVCEPLARLGARVTGIDPAAENIEAARRHAAGQGLDIDYRAARIEDLVAEGRTFDAVICLEVVEHVPDVGAFLKMLRGAGAAGRPDAALHHQPHDQGLSAGHRRRGVRAALAAGRHAPVGAVRDARGAWRGICAAAGLGAPVLQGLVYSPLADTWSLSGDTDVNYFAAAAKPG